MSEFSKSNDDSSQHISLVVSHRGRTYPLSVLPTGTLSSLQTQLEQLTSVPPGLQKLLYGGRKKSETIQQESGGSSLTLLQAGLKDGMKIQMLGSTAQELEGLKAAEDGMKKRDRILQERALKTPTKV
jgi:Ubiquitin family